MFFNAFWRTALPGFLMCFGGEIFFKEFINGGGKVVVLGGLINGLK